MESKLNRNVDLVAQARASAPKVADDVQAFIDEHTTVTVERAVCRLLGVSLKNAHRAVHDAAATAQCLVKMLEEAAKKGA